jgi:Uma2 family endonuclease
MTRAASALPTRPPRPPTSPPAVQHLVLDNADWDLYERLLGATADRPIRISYDNGRLEMMSPLPEHERVKSLIHDLVRLLTLELNVPMKCLGSTTFRREDKAKGLEPDDCYYFKHARRMRGKKRVNLKRGDPAPELVVEVDITRRSVPREPIYAGLGVPEIWRWDGRKLECLTLADDTYAVRDTSLAFPTLTPADLTRFVKLLPDADDDNEILRAFVAWVRAGHSSNT